MNKPILSEQAYSNGEYLAKPLVQGAHHGGFQGVVVVAPISDEEGATRCVLPTKFASYKDALEDAKQTAQVILQAASLGSKPELAG